MYYFTKPYKDVPQNEDVITMDPVIKEVNGAKVQMFVARTEDLNKGLTYDDFSLRSLMDADAFDLLQPCVPISRGQLYTADLANTATVALGSYFDALTSNTDKKDE